MLCQSGTTVPCTAVARELLLPHVTQGSNGISENRPKGPKADPTPHMLIGPPGIPFCGPIALRARRIIPASKNISPCSLAKST